MDFISINRLIHIYLILTITYILLPHPIYSIQCLDQYHLITTDSKTYTEAHSYCESQYNTHLATIYNDCGKNEIKTKCVNNSCWIGIDVNYNTETNEDDIHYNDNNIEYGSYSNIFESPQPNTYNGTKLCGSYNGMSDIFELTECNIDKYFLCNINDNIECEDKGLIKHLNWNELMKNGDINNSVPFINYILNVDIATLDLNIFIDIEYLGYSIGERHAHIGTTYVFGFEEFEGDGNGKGIDIPGNCQNRKEIDFIGKTWNEYWKYSDTPYIDGHIGSIDYLAYPPNTKYWQIFNDKLDSNSTAGCSRVHYRASFEWTDLVNDCKTANGTRNLIILKTDNKWMNLTGTFFGSIVSPLSDIGDTGFYRVYQLIHQSFVISVSKSSSIISSTGINLFTMSLVAVYKEDNENKPNEDDFKLIVLTESADYLYLTSPKLVVTPSITSAIFSIIDTPYSGQQCIISTHSAICSQLWEIYAMNVQCPPNTFSGTYAIQWNATCDNIEDIEDISSSISSSRSSSSRSSSSRSSSSISSSIEDIEDPCNEYINNYGEEVLLSADLTWTDDICDEQIWIIQFEGIMNFYKNMIFTEPQGDYLYVIGEDRVYAEVIINYPSTTYSIFQSSLTNVWICSIDPDIDRNDNDELIFISQDLSKLGCLDETITDQDGPYWIIQNYNQQFLHKATHHIVSDGTSNKIRFSFIVPDTIIRDKIYVHAQITLSLVSGNDQNIQRRILLNVDGIITDNNNNNEHKPNVLSNPDPKQFAKNEDKVTNMDQIRHFGASSGVIKKILFGDEELRKEWNKKLLIVSTITCAILMFAGFIGFKIHKSDPINWGRISDLIEMKRLRRLERLRMIGGGKGRVWYGPVRHDDSETVGIGDTDYDDNDLLMSHDDGCNDHM